MYNSYKLNTEKGFIVTFIVYTQYDHTKPALRRATHHTHTQT